MLRVPVQRDAVDHERVAEKVDVLARVAQAVSPAEPEAVVNPAVVGTSMAAIAARAGVDARTVYKIFGTKVDLLSRLVDVAMVGDQEAVPVVGRPWAAGAFDAPTGAARASAFASAIRQVMERAGVAFRTAAQAAVAEPQAAALWALGQRKREQDATSFVAALQDAAMLRSDRTPAHAVATVWLLTSPETYLQLTDSLGWTLDEYERWLDRSLADALLEPATP